MSETIFTTAPYMANEFAPMNNDIVSDSAGKANTVTNPVEAAQIEAGNQETVEPSFQEDDQEWTEKYSTLTGKPNKVPYKLSEQQKLAEKMGYNPQKLVINLGQAEAEARSSNRKTTKAVRLGKRALKAQTAHSKHSESIMSKTLMPVDTARRELNLKRAERAKRKANEKELKAAAQYKKLKEAEKVFKNYGGEAPSAGMGPAVQHEYEKRKEYLGDQIGGYSDRFNKRIKKVDMYTHRQSAGDKNKLQYEGTKETIDRYARRRDFWHTFYHEWRALRAAERAKKQLAKARIAHERYKRINR